MGSNVLSGLEPAAVYGWFERLCAIPHGSYNTRAVSDFCAAFARARGLKYRQDAANNIIIWKAGTPGYEDHPPVILQGHLDMVCEKEADCDLDFQRDGLRLAVEDGWVYARGTTLGGDDGIAVAYALAILDSSDIPHPPIEALFTTDEEVGMLGAAALDTSDLRGRVLLNIDSEEEGILTVGCAGGASCTLTLPCQSAPADGGLYRLSVGGLTGGHSGAEIHTGRANANKLLGEVLAALLEAAPLRLAGVWGGTKDNAITRDAYALAALPAGYEARMYEIAGALEKTLQARCAETDPALRVTCEPTGEQAGKAWDTESTKRVVELLCALPYGVQAMSRDMPGLVETSDNVGIVKASAEAQIITVSVRSSVAAEKEALTAKLRALAEAFGAAYAQEGDYPAWEYRKDSPLRALMVEVYEAQYGKKPAVLTIHAGLECGLLAEKLPGLDSVSFGPDLEGIHTTRERMSVASVERTWRYLCAVLAHL